MIINKKKFLVALALTFVLPGLAMAAYNDVSLTTSAIVLVGSDSLNVSGSTASVQSLTVGSTSFSVEMLSGSSLIVTSTAGKTYSLSGTSAATSYSVSCGSGGQSTLNITQSGGSATTVTVQLLSNSCVATGGSSGSSSSGSGSTSSSGGGSTVTTPTVVATPVVTTPSIVAPTVVKPSLTTPSAVSGSSSTVITPSTPVVMITRVFSVGQTSDQVKSIQVILNSDPATRISSSGVGSSGRETMTFGGLTLKAIKKFQEKWGIAKNGDTGYGVVGPKTRAKLNEVGKMLGQTGAAPSLPPASVSPAQPTSTQALIISLLEQIKLLQAELNKLNAQ